MSTIVFAVAIPCVCVFFLLTIWWIIRKILDFFAEHKTFQSTAQVIGRQHRRAGIEWIYINSFPLPVFSCGKYRVYLEYEGKIFWIDDKGLFMNSTRGKQIGVNVQECFIHRIKLTKLSI